MIGLFGLNHKSAPIEIREKFVFCEEDIRRFVPEIKAKGILGAVVLSTCNRTEIYFRVISGLDSMTLGEYQIVSQIKDAFQVSKKNNFCSSVDQKFNEEIKFISGSFN